jgi:L-aminopeptidase/D-esterase-like protein
MREGITKPRARDLGVPFQGQPGRWNALTDVPGVEVGHTTLISGGDASGETVPVLRTGVTAILPRGRRYDPVFAAWYSLNGCGEMTGTTWIEESGFLESGILLTNTTSVGTAHDAAVSWAVSRLGIDRESMRDLFWFLPVAGETTDGFLNGWGGAKVSEAQVHAALDAAAGGPVGEGSVGGGTGMICHEFKGGIGTASRVVEIDGQAYTLGVLVQANYGDREDLTVAGVPVGREIPDLMPEPGRMDWGPGEGSILVMVATDAPLLPHQLKRLARRVPLGIAHMGGYGANTSGDLFLAFSTANLGGARSAGLSQVRFLPNGQMNPLLQATIQATEESITNALVAAETMRGANGAQVYALPHDRLVEILRKYNRLGK